jgi:hypothetical protein
MKRSLVRRVILICGSVLILIFACYLAYAFSTGITGQTKKSTQTAGCGAKPTGGGGCHGTSADTNIQVLLTGPSVLPVGTPGTYTISLTGATASGGGCDIAASSGTLSSSSSLLQFLNQELTHVSPIATPYSIEFTYVSNSPGTVTLYANGRASTGWNWAPNFSLRVGPPPAPSPVLPADGSSAVPTSIVLVWSGIVGPKWIVEVSTSQSFASVLVRSDSLADTTYTIPEGVLANNTQYFWRVRGADPGGNSGWSQAWSFTTAVTGVEEANGSVPARFALEQNYPNPFNPSTRIKYTIGVTGGEWQVASGEDGGSGVEGRGESNVRLVVYDMLGREVAVLVNENQVPGNYEVHFDGGGLASGIYIYRLTTNPPAGQVRSPESKLSAQGAGAGSFVQSRKMLLLR